MTLQEIRNNPITTTVGVAAAMVDAPAKAYILHSLDRFFAGDYGETPAEDIDANNKALHAGTGRIVARYQAAEGLRQDIFIIAYFSDQEPGNNDYNYTTVMYTSEY